MLFPIILGLLGAVYGWLMISGIWYGPPGLVDYGFTAFITVVCGAFGAGIGTGIASGIGACLPSKYVFTRQMELVAMKDTLTITGNFFLGTGTINSEPAYIFYRKDGAGVKFDSVPAKNATVYEGPRDFGLINVYEKRFVNRLSNEVGINWGGEIYCIFVPQGSVKREFVLDLK